jgi:hypothetical protein
VTTTALVPEKKAPTNGTEGKLKTELHFGVPVLPLHVGDAIPTPRAPTRYAVRVYPDLARYLLTFNHPQNRTPKPSMIVRYARDMANGYWAFTPESLVFSTTPMLEDGQNRLRAVEESGVSVWIMCDFGWPVDLIERINRGSARTNADALSVNGYRSANIAAAAVVVIQKYLATEGTPLRWTQQLLTASEALEEYRKDPTGWDEAGQWGSRLYAATAGLGPTTWATAFYLVAGRRGIAVASDFFQQVIDETGEPGSAPRRLKSHYIRRKLTDTASGDRREPLENIIRAFNAWSAGKPVGFVRTGGAFVLSSVRKADKKTS